MAEMKIRNIVGDMPYDSQGRHCTGREVWTQAAAGNLCGLAALVARPQSEAKSIIDRGGHYG